jgi:predicted secreted protein
MTWQQAIIVYAISWWLLLFIALPFGYKQAENSIEGANPSSPQKTYLGIKCLVVTLLAALVTWAIDIVIHSGIVAVR